MKQLLRFTLCCFVLLAASFLVLSPAQAAPSLEKPKAKLSVNVNIDQANIFWNYTFLTKDTDLAKPESIKLIWSRGDSPSKEKSEVIVMAGKSTGKALIETDKGALVNLRVCVYGPKRLKLGTIDLQVLNNGQSEFINITPPEYTEPNMTWGNVN